MNSVYLSVGGVIVKISSELDFSTGEVLRTFLTAPQCAHCEVTVDADFDSAIHPAQSCGSDLLLDYYREGNICWAVTRPGTRGSALCTVYSHDLSAAAVHLNEKEYPNVIRSVEKILQLFPVRELFTAHGVLMLHASRISSQGRAILFTAPSGTGKTTQANLWRDYAGAELLCNDRTLVRKGDDAPITGGYPVDGSAPVCSAEERPLGAVVVLRQGSENTAARLPVARALSLLMSQTVTDAWNHDELFTQQQLWLDILQTCPAYLLTCTPDRAAVECLHNQLIKDGVLHADFASGRS